MNELTNNLSTDINVITAEINSYKQVAGQAIFEIGRRLKYVKENDLQYGEFGEWTESVGIQKHEASRYIKIIDELDEEELGTYTTLGTKALYLIATIPANDRNQTHTTDKGEQKTPDEMTVKELQSLKRSLKEAEQAKQQAESEAESAKRSEDIATRKLEEAESREPEVQEKEIVKEVVPEDYHEVKGLYKAAKQSGEWYKKQFEELEEYIDERDKENPEETDEWKESADRMKFLVQKTNEMLELISPIRYSMDFDVVKSDKSLMDEIARTVNSVSMWVEDMENELPNEDIIEGDFTNE